MATDVNLPSAPKVWYGMVCYIVLCCAVLCYIVLYYIILYTISLLIAAEVMVSVRCFMVEVDADCEELHKPVIQHRDTDPGCAALPVAC